MNNKYIIFSDVDGTIYSSDYLIKPETIIDIKSAQNIGIEFAICTGNGFFEKMENLSKEINARYAIFSNGATIYDLQDKKYIVNNFCNQKNASSLLEIANKLKLGSCWWDLENVYVNEFTDEKAEVIIRDTMLGRGNLKKQSYIDKDVLNMEFFGDENKIDEIEKFINDLPLSYARINKNHIVVTSDTSTKGQAIKTLCDYLKIPLENTMAIGDSNNDLSMMSVSNYTYAMANANDTLKKAVKYHTSSVEQNGLGEAIVDFIYRIKA